MVDTTIKKHIKIDCCQTFNIDRFQISQSAISNLLDIMHEFHLNIPKDAKTLLQMPRHNDVKQIAGGSYL